MKTNGSWTAPRSPGTLTVFYGFVALGIVLATVVVWAIVNTRLNDFQVEAVRGESRLRSEALHDAIGREIYLETTRMTRVGDVAVESGAEATTELMRFAATTSARLDWMALATADGGIAASSLPDGAQITAEDEEWLHRAQEAAFAPELLAFRPGGRIEGLRTTRAGNTITLSIPVTDETGSLVHVVGARISAQWLASYMSGAAERLGLDAVLYDGRGDPIVATEGLAGLSDETLLRSRVRHASAGELWRREEDGRLFMDTTIAGRSYPGLPPMSWRLMTRSPLDRLQLARQQFIESVVMGVTGFGIFFGGLVYLFGRLYLHPFRDLAQNCVRILRGDQHYPYESYRTRELATFSAGLALLQSLRQKELDRQEDTDSDDTAASLQESERVRNLKTS